MELSDDDQDSPWDFKSARRFLKSYNPSALVELSENDSIPNPNNYNPKSQAPKGLGDFERLFAFCGKPMTIPPRRRSLDSSSTQNEENTTPLSSAPEDEAIIFEEFVNKAKEVRWTDQEGTADLAEYRRRSTRGSETGDLDASVISQLLEETDPSGFESDTEDETAPISSRTRAKKGASHTSPAQSSPKKGVKTKSISPCLCNNLLPASVTPPRKLFEPQPIPPPPINPHDFVDPAVVKPLHTLTANEQKAKLAKKLARRFVSEATLIKDPETVTRLGGNKHPKGIHVFIDLSNIVIGFCDRIKLNRVRAGKIQQGARVKQPPFSFHSLALILERGRQVGRRVLVGSTSNALYDPYSSERKLPDHIVEAERLGYEPNILERVAKPHRGTPQKKKGGAGSGYATSGYSSASETQVSGRLKMQEQAVDELLQMKMLETLVDFEPSTIVLASGDAAEAEYSGGFLKTVQRALEKGWKVEVVAWAQGFSHEYRHHGLLTKYKDKLTIIELDEFCEEMLAIYTQKWLQTFHV
ncbi:hypothetical protein BDZ45DRAFT_668083 [Acephala macrosclerotiorum]|nr:hypothetical protein BDZ45DRAFT_668083 [Acephala macrosclerotiorum]